jgi:hypothetical protein
MYCTIIEKQSKKKPHRSNVYRKIEWHAYTSGILEGSGTWYQEDEIQREPREKWDIVLNESYRENGKVKKRQHHIYTVTYWDIIGGWYSESIHERINGYLNLKIMEELGISKEDIAAERKRSDSSRPLRDKIKAKLEEFGDEYKRIDDLIYSRLQPIIDRVMKEYKGSEEYKVKTQNEKLRKAKEKELEAEKQYQKKKYETDSIMGQGYYDAHYYKDGSFNSKGAKEWAKTHKESQKQNESKNNYDYSSYFKGFNIGTSSFNANEKVMAEELITAGYKQLSKKYHPDVGGTTEKFQELGSLKDKLLKLT